MWYFSGHSLYEIFNMTAYFSIVGHCVCIVFVASYSTRNHNMKFDANTYIGQGALQPPDSAVGCHRSQSYGVVLMKHDKGMWSYLQNDSSPMLTLSETDTICRAMGYTHSVPNSLWTVRQSKHIFKNHTYKNLSERWVSTYQILVVVLVHILGLGSIVLMCSHIMVLVFYTCISQIKTELEHSKQILAHIIYLVSTDFWWSDFNNFWRLTQLFFVSDDIKLKYTIIIYFLSLFSTPLQSSKFICSDSCQCIGCCVTLTNENSYSPRPAFANYDDAIIIRCGESTQ